MAIEVSVGTESIRNYKRLSYEVWYAIAEFIDNSTQSYFNNREILDQTFASEGFDRLEVRVVYDREQDVLRITDTAMGMDLSELDQALQIARPPADVAGRNEFGMGLKTAACWLGNLWTVRTKKLGETHEYRIDFDVEKVASGSTSLEATATPKPAEMHYTVIEIRQMHFKIQGRTIGKIKDYLRSMYRVDVRSGDLALYWDQETLEYEDSLDLLKGADGEPYRKPFEFDIGGRKVHGWIAVLRSGGRPKAGFAIIRRGRVIQGQPTAWRPSEIFGQEQGSNTLLAQRLAGEINLDDFMVSHTKNAILWQGSEEEDIEKALFLAASDYIHVAKKFRKGGSGSGGPSQAEIDAAVDEFKSELESSEFIDLLEIDEVPPPEAIEASLEPLLKGASGAAPTIAVDVGKVKCRVYLSDAASPNDPYYAADYAPEHVTVVVNAAHPHFSHISGSEGVLNYLRHCVYDAIAEWRCTQKVGSIQPDTVKLIKDAYLRMPFTMM